MDVEEFIRRVGSEPPRTVTKTVRIPPPEIFETLEDRGWMSLTELQSASGTRIEKRSVRYGHILGPPAPVGSIETWQGEKSRLPADLVHLVGRMNGIHLWADLDEGRAYEGLAPINEWELARIKMWGAAADRNTLDDRYHAISYHQDGAAFAVLDVVSGKYFLMDAAGADETCPIGDCVGDLLDWLWKSRIDPGLGVPGGRA